MVAFLIDNDKSGFITGSDHLVDGGAVIAGGLKIIEGNPVSVAYEYIEK